ncbi:MAG: hypothetical protein JO053_07050 [Acidobacteria bacterium]|nr:hypothetical protein [Acidobacteriota bacterium]
MNTHETQSIEQPSLPFAEPKASVQPPVPTSRDTDKAGASGADLIQLQTENADLKAAIRLRDVRDAVTKELSTRGARSPELLFDAVKGELQFDEEGRLVNQNALVAKLTGGFPEQFARETPVGIDGGAGRFRTPTLTKETLSRMSAEEIAKMDWNEVRKVLAQG